MLFVFLRMQLMPVNLVGTDYHMLLQVCRFFNRIWLIVFDEHNSILCCCCLVTVKNLDGMNRLCAILSFCPLFEAQRRLTYGNVKFRCVESIDFCFMFGKRSPSLHCWKWNVFFFFFYQFTGKQFNCDFVRNIRVSVTFAALLINEKPHHYHKHLGDLLSRWLPLTCNCIFIAFDFFHTITVKVFFIFMGMLCNAPMQSNT